MRLRDTKHEGGRMLCNEELYDLYPSPSIILVIKSRRMSWAGHVAILKKGEVHRGVWWGKTEEKKPYGRRRCRWESNLKMNI